MKVLWLFPIACWLFIAPLLIAAQYNEYTVNNPIFDSLEGKTADPCHKYVTSTLPDCSTLPDAHVTVLLPSETSPASFIGGINVQANVVAGTHILSILGRNFASKIGAAGTTTTVATGDALLGCSSVTYTSTATVVNEVSGGITVRNRLEFPVNPNWVTVARELEDLPRPLCVLIAGAYQYTGFKIGVVWNCQPSGTTCPPPPVVGSASKDIRNGYNVLTFDKLRERLNRGTCCVNADYAANKATSTLRVGQCSFTQASGFGPTACCGSAVVESAVETCCNSANEWIRFRTQSCPCRGPTASTENVNALCPSGQTCCYGKKYTEFALSGLSGECYNSTTHACCDSGARYDPGSSQCCPINGVQSLNIPCPCSADAHCPTDKPTQKCCYQTNDTVLFENSTCGAYANFPSGTGPYQSQRCPGTCFDTNFQICCNGVHCVRAFEKCCNTTCCNRLTQSCGVGRRNPTPGNRFNYNEVNVLFETCTTNEHHNIVKIAVMVVLPVFLLIITLVATVICLVFANKASSRSYAAIEKAMIYIATFLIIIDMILYFSVAWKYGLFILFVQCFTIVTAAARVRALNIWCLVLAVVLFIYVVDPFHGNNYLTLASHRTSDTANPYRNSAGLIHVIGDMNPRRTDTQRFSVMCWIHFIFGFLRDPLLRDTDRLDNPERQTYGYCDRGYVLVLLVFCALIYICVFLQMALTLLALLLRFKKPSLKLVYE